jgi:hypothetical protein
VTGAALVEVGVGVLVERDPITNQKDIFGVSKTAVFDAIKLKLFSKSFP